MQQKKLVRLSVYATLGVAAIAVFSRGQVTPVEGQAVREDKILFVSNRADKEKFGIFTMNPDGSQQISLTKGDAIELDPAWSPDGKQIVFAVANPKERKMDMDIYAMNADGSERKRLVDGKPMALSPVWSPDGKRIAFAAMQVDGGSPPKIFINVADADGKNVKRLSEGMMPAWSPDGKQILYTTFPGQSGDEGVRLNIVDADGKKAKPLTGKGRAAMGAFSPDGKRIVYIGEGGGDQPDVFVMNADGSKPTQLVKTEDTEIGPQWSPDGKRIFFTRIPKSDAEKAAIYVMDADGKNVKSLTDNTALNLLGGGAFFMMMRSGPPGG